MLLEIERRDSGHQRCGVRVAVACELCLVAGAARSLNREAGSEDREMRTVLVLSRDVRRVGRADRDRVRDALRRERVEVLDACC
jgi:hypothetical protein